MKRQSIDGKPIYSQELWEKMLAIGEILEALGYKESSKKPNLFYKIIKKGRRKILIYADLRGSWYEPLWREFKLRVYSFERSELMLGFEAITLQRFIKIPIEVDNFYSVSLSELDGYCKSCESDILENKDKTIAQFNYKKNLKIELQYCDNCKSEAYEQIRKRIRKEAKRRRRAKLCPLCRKRNKKVNHHITYEPENTIDICRSCHNMIHHRYGFPNPLWKQKDPTPKNQRRKKQKENFRTFRLLYKMLENFQSVFYAYSLTDLTVISKFIDKFEDLHYDLRGNKFIGKKYFYPKIVYLRIGLLDYYKYLKKYNGTDIKLSRFKILTST